MRHAKQLTTKSRQHLITRFSDSQYILTSGSSGRKYVVNPIALTCTCPYGQHRPQSDKRSGCSHVLGVLSYIKEMEEERTLSACATEDEVMRSKRSIAGGFDNLILVSRKV